MHKQAVFKAFSLVLSIPVEFLSHIYMIQGMDGNGCFGNLVQKCKPYIAMISLQFGYAGMNIITKVSLDRGMSHYALVAYRNAFAAAVVAPFAIFLERKIRPKMTLPIFMQIFALGLLGPVIDQNFYYAGLKLTSPTFSCGISNILPAMTFILAFICRMENVDIKKLQYQASILGTLVTLAGVMLMTWYKGHVMRLFGSDNIQPQSLYVHASDKDLLKGSIPLIFSALVWATFFILQATTLERYPAQLSLTALVCSLGTLQSIAVTYVMEHNPSVWTIGFNMNLFTAAYAGIVSSGIAYYVQGKVMEKRGPVFATTFSPLMMIIVGIMSSFLIGEKIYVEGVLGAVLILLGVYSVLWGKHKEYKEMEADAIHEAIKDCAKHGHMVTILVETNEENVTEMQKSTEVENSSPIIAIGMSVNSQISMMSRDSSKA